MPIQTRLNAVRTVREFTWKIESIMKEQGFRINGMDIYNVSNNVMQAAADMAENGIDMTGMDGTDTASDPYSDSTAICDQTISDDAYNPHPPPSPGLARAGLQADAPRGLANS